jgi:hypothetical protein
MLQEQDQAIQTILNATGNRQNFIKRGRGYVDWKFSELCLYNGYKAAKDYVISMRSWHDFQKKYSTCLLETSYVAFQQALNTQTT